MWYCIKYLRYRQTMHSFCTARLHHNSQTLGLGMKTICKGSTQKAELLKPSQHRQSLRLMQEKTERNANDEFARPCQRGLSGIYSRTRILLENTTEQDAERRVSGGRLLGMSPWAKGKKKKKKKETRVTVFNLQGVSATVQTNAWSAAAKGKIRWKDA